MQDLVGARLKSRTRSLRVAKLKQLVLWVFLSANLVYLVYELFN